MNIELLKEICEIAGAPGFERRISDLVLKNLEGLADDIHVDNMGNITAFKKGRSDKKVMIAAHMDEIGFIVTHVDDKGFIKFHTLADSIQKHLPLSA